MRKKDKKIDVTLEDTILTVQDQKVEGLALSLGSRVIGQLIETDQGFNRVENQALTDQYKTLDGAINAILENYHLNH